MTHNDDRPTFQKSKIIIDLVISSINISQEIFETPIIAIETSSQIEQELDFLNRKVVESIKNCTNTLKQNAARIKIPDHLALK